MSKEKPEHLIAIDIPKGATKWFFTAAQDCAILFYGKKDELLSIFDMDKYVKFEKGTDGKMYHYPPDILGISKHHKNKLLVEVSKI